MTFNENILLREPRAATASDPPPLDPAEATRRRLAAAIAELDDLKSKDHANGVALYQVLVEHTRSSCPQALLVETGPVALTEPCNHAAEIDGLNGEIEKLKQEADVMRPIYVAALSKRESEHDFREATKDCRACAEEPAGPCSAHQDVFDVMITRDGELDEVIDAASREESAGG